MFDEATAGVVSKAPNNDNTAVKVNDMMGGDEPLDEDEFDEVVECFESSYNFCFEEPYVHPPACFYCETDVHHHSDAPHIPSFPCVLETVWQPAAHMERWKDARKRCKEHKEEELHVWWEEVKRLKKLKMGAAGED